MRNYSYFINLSVHIWKKHTLWLNAH